MSALPRPRRLALAAIALAAAFALFHGQIAAAVVTRGDDALRAGDIGTAIRLYDRASHLDSRSAIAADRLAFYLALRHDRVNALLAIVIANRTIRRGTMDSSLFADRAFAELQLRRWEQAELDFDHAGQLAHDARYEHFAARMALRLGDRAAARRYARIAIADDPHFEPARALLRRLS